MQACREGSSEAFGRLFERYRDDIGRFFRRRVLNPARAEDLAQETFVAALRSVPRYEARNTFRSYLFGIAFNVLSDDRRKPHAMIDARADADVMASLRASTPNLDEVLHVRRAVEALDPIDRDVVMLREFDALSYGEIAEALAIPLNTVRSRLFRARMALKENLQ
jgi:RNA polymerase sigma-70 factor (ECF subfamily)